MNKVMVGVLVLLATPATAQKDEAVADHSGAVREVSVPEAGVERTVSVGSPIHEYSRRYEVQSQHVITDQQMRVAPLGFPTTVEAHTPMISVDTRARFKACVAFGPCAIDDDGDGTFDRLAADDFARAFRLRVSVPYRRETVTSNVRAGVRQVILYHGASGDTLRLSYREFTTDDMARPAFTEELSIPLTRQFPQLVAVKGIRLRIHGIDGLGLRYEVVPVGIPNR